MSLAIQVDAITAVLLPGGWHEVTSGSFDIDSYEFKDGTLLLHGGGQDGIAASGFVFSMPDGLRLAGPLTSILAVRRGTVTLKPADSTVLPEWCGECDGPEPDRRLVDCTAPDGSFPKVRKCPNCHPHAAV